MWATLLGAGETHFTALGPDQVLKCFHDGLWAFITLTFLLHVVLAVYPLKETSDRTVLSSSHASASTKKGEPKCLQLLLLIEKLFESNR